MMLPALTPRGTLLASKPLARRRQDRGTRVERILVARWLRALLLGHAKRAGEPGRLIRRAQAVLGQPKRAAAHDDHFHLRVQCAPHERRAGCLDAGQRPR